MTSSFSLWVQAARSAVAGRIVVSIDTMLRILSDTQLFIKTINAFSNSGTTAHALSMNVLDMVNLVKGNYDGKVKRVPSSPFTFPR